MLMVGTVDRSTRQTIIATLDRAAASGNQGTTPVGPSPVSLWTDPRSSSRNPSLTRENVVFSQDPECGARFPALR